MTTGTPISSQQSSIFYVTKVLPGNNSYDRIFSIGTSTSGYFSQLNTIASQNFICWYNNKVSLGGDFYSQRLITFYNDSTTQYLRQDGVQIDSDSKTASSYGSKDIFKYILVPTWYVFMIYSYYFTFKMQKDYSATLVVIDKWNEKAGADVTILGQCIKPGDKSVIIRPN